MKNVNVYAILITLLLLLSGCSSGDKLSNQTTIEDFLPKTPIIKYYDGGFENFGEIELIDKISDTYYQQKSLNLAIGIIQVFKVIDGKLIKVYSSETEEFKEDYLEEKSNVSVVQLQEPIEVGTKWEIYSNNIAEITDINVEIVTPLSTFNCVEVTSHINESTIKQYYAKDIGLVKTILDDYYSSSLIAIDENINSININNVEETLNELYIKNNEKGGN